MTTENHLLNEVEHGAVARLRAELHQEPELSNGEWKTQAKLLQALARFGIDGAVPFHGTGLYVDIRGAAPGRAVALRGDIDALPISEDRPDLPYRSQIPGVMHACGHDVHASLALGTAAALHRMRHSFKGRVRVFFHPAEEAEPLGGRSVEADRLLDGFDAALGFHVNPGLPIGTFSARPGPVSKAADQFRIRFLGEMAHGAVPHAGVDAITIAAGFVNEIQKIVSRETCGDDGVVITVGTITGGTASNIVCDEVVLEGTIRTRNRHHRDTLAARVKAVAEGMAALHRGSADVGIVQGEPPVVNDAEMTELFRRLVGSLHGAERFTDSPQPEGSDDFGFYSKQLPSLYFWIGTGQPGFEAPVHTPQFAVPDVVLPSAADMVLRTCLALLGRSDDPTP